MTTLTNPPFVPLGPPAPRSNVVFEERGYLPGWVNDLPSFRRWIWSDDFPTQGYFAFLGSDVWVDLSMEELITHNQVRLAFSFSVMSILEQQPIGRYVADRMFLTNAEASLSTEPDGLFFLYATVQASLLRFIDKPEVGIMELEGTPDMVLEVVSKTSVRKDTVILPQLYWKAKIPEFWLVDARPGSLSFKILLRGAEGYEEAPAQDGWIRSPLFGRDFSIQEELDPLGKRLFRVRTR